MQPRRQHRKFSPCRLLLQAFAFGLAAICAALFARFAQAQLSTGDVIGTVTDTSDAVIPGARVTLTNTAVDAGYTVVIDPRPQPQEIPNLVRQGFLVRTLADFLTIEPRTGNYSRSTAAFNSKAQVISTDYYRPDPKFSFPYHLTGFPGQSWVRCNPLNAPARCDSTLLDPTYRYPAIRIDRATQFRGNE